MTTLATRQRSAFRFRGRSFLALVLTPELPVSDWLAEVDRWLSRAPGFFTGKPLVLDVAGLSLAEPEFVSLISELAARKIQLLGVEGAEPSWQRDGLPPLLMGGRAAGMIELPDSPASRPAAPAAPAPQPAKAASALLIDKPVRSGQSIVNPDGDVTVVGSVASGAEIVAAGSIHVYGALRGRALAGMYGDGGARIFCSRLEAELLAIDGYYKVADELEPQLYKKPIHARLERGIVHIITLD